MGKTALLTATRLAALDEGFDVLAAQSSEFERDYAFGVVRQLFEGRVRRVPALFEGAAASARPAFDLPGAGGAGGSDSGSLAVLHGLYWLTVNACAETPVMLVVDDVHWCDQASLRFLAYVGRRLEGSSLMIVMALRRSEQSREDPLVAELARQPGGVTLEPAPLTEAAVARLLEARLGVRPHAGFTAACCRPRRQSPAP